MARIKSLIGRVEVDNAKHAHNCQRDARHRIFAGDRRLKVRNRRGWDHYCVACAKQIVDLTQNRLDEIQELLINSASNE